MVNKRILNINYNIFPKKSRIYYILPLLEGDISCVDERGKANFYNRWFHLLNEKEKKSKNKPRLFVHYVVFIKGIEAYDSSILVESIVGSD